MILGLKNFTNHRLKIESYNLKKADFSDAIHCCKEMTDFVYDYRVPIDFNPERTRYFLPLMWPHSGTQGLSFCPWCGVRLPAIIEKEATD